MTINTNQIWILNPKMCTYKDKIIKIRFVLVTHIWLIQITQIASRNSNWFLSWIPNTNSKLVSIVISNSNPISM